VQPQQRPQQVYHHQQQHRFLHGHALDPVRLAGLASVQSSDRPQPLASSSSSSSSSAAAASSRRRLLSTSSPSSSHDGAGGGFATERDYHAAADEALDEVQAHLEGLEDTVEDFEANLAVRILLECGGIVAWVGGLDGLCD
jgi:hypothetical protein